MRKGGHFLCMIIVICHHRDSAKLKKNVYVTRGSASQSKQSKQRFICTHPGGTRPLHPKKLAKETAMIIKNKGNIRELEKILFEYL